MTSLKFKIVSSSTAWRPFQSDLLQCQCFNYTGLPVPLSNSKVSGWNLFRTSPTFIRSSQQQIHMYSSKENQPCSCEGRAPVLRTCVKALILRRCSICHLCVASTGRTLRERCCTPLRASYHWPKWESDRSSATVMRRWYVYRNQKKKKHKRLCISLRV